MTRANELWRTIARNAYRFPANRSRSSQCTEVSGRRRTRLGARSF
jgi:hypothetical protein